MDQQYSTLELVRFDGTARAPELQSDIVAVELNASVSAPQVREIKVLSEEIALTEEKKVVPDTTKQVLYDTSSPEVHGNQKGKPITDYSSSSHEVKPRLKRPWVVVMAFVIAAAIAIAVGVGIWRHRDHKQSATIIIPSATSFILNDTSLAAVVLPDARHLFFQDVNGRIRHAVRTTQSAQWTMSPKMGPGSDMDFGAKNHTPLAATSYDSALYGYQINLYYVSEGHVLNSSFHSDGGWSSAFFDGNYSTAPNTRSLSVAALGITPPLTVVNSTTVNSTNLALLYYENSSGNVSALLQQGDRWVDITSQDSKSLPQEFRNIEESDSYTLDEAGNFGTLSTPFACGANWSFPGAIGAIFYTPNLFFPNTTSPEGFADKLYSVDSSGPGTFFGTVGVSTSSDISPIRIDSSIHQSDIALLGRAGAIWINRTQPVVEYRKGTLGPDSAFPFTRLASATSADYSSTYLYHQMNGTTFAEEQWNEDAGEWGTPQYITLSDS